MLPVDDFGVREGYRRAYGGTKQPTPKDLRVFGERWAPYRSVAAWYLWRAVDLHKIGKLPAPAIATRIAMVKKRKAAKQKTVAKKKTRPSVRAKK